jgi:hypothetical protein
MTDLKRTQASPATFAERFKRWIAYLIVFVRYIAAKVQFHPFFVRYFHIFSFFSVHFPAFFLHNTAAAKAIM